MRSYPRFSVHLVMAVAVSVVLMTSVVQAQTTINPGETLTINPDDTLYNSINDTIINNGTVINEGTLLNEGIINGDGEIRNNGVIDNFGSLYIDKMLFNCLALNAVCAISNWALVQTMWVENYSGGEIDNNGSEAEMLVAKDLTNRGAARNALNASLSIGGTLQNSGDFFTEGILDANVIVNDSTGIFNVFAGEVYANSIINNFGSFFFTGGTLNVDTFNGDLANTGGTLGPGHSPGTTTINGDYSQDASSTLLIEIEGLIAGAEYDVINVTGTATLDGVLDFYLDYSGLVLGDSFDILSAEVINGTFASITDQQINTNWIWELDYNLDPSGTDILTARVTAVPIPEPTTLLLAILALAAVPLRVRRG